LSAVQLPQINASLLINKDFFLCSARKHRPEPSAQGAGFPILAVENFAKKSVIGHILESKSLIYQRKKYLAYLMLTLIVNILFARTI
jgi:hypothetical protein